MSDDWRTVLDRIERQLAAVEAALEHHTDLDLDAEPAGGAPVLGPLPAELGPRAEVLLARSRSLEVRAERERDRIGASLQALARRRHPAPRTRTGRVVDVGA